MKKAKGNIWDVLGKSDCICITTNSMLKKDGSLVMGAGVAYQAAKRFPELPYLAGTLVKGDYGFIPVDVGNPTTIGLLQTKRSPFEKSPAELVELSVLKLLIHVNNVRWEDVHLVMPGVGLGGLDKEVVLDILGILDKRFTVWTN